MSSQAKVLRGQLRQIAKDLLPELLSEEFKASIHKELAAQVQNRLDMVIANIKEVLDTIDKRSRDTQNHIVKQALTLDDPAKVGEVK